ncbi:MAG: right-handed parallel beta-helix repeat-containing protein [Myxococcales bacterium]
MGRHAVLAAALLVANTAFAGTLQVGPGKQYAKPCAAFAAAQAGDTVEIDAAGNGTYDGDVCGFNKADLVIRGVNGRAKIDAAGKNAQGKAIWVIQGANNTVENIELSGCTVQDQNGAGIRQEGRNLTVRGCYFHDNENGILTGADAQSEILIETSEFANNGYGDGYSHNMYIGHVGKFTLRSCYSHHAKIGHLVKSRAAQNFILYNKLIDAADGTASYEIDLPNGGTSVILGNVIQQGQGTDNSTIVSYRAEGGSAENPGDDLYFVNNTVVDNRSPAGMFVRVNATTPAVIKNNIFRGAGQVTNQANAVLANNLVNTDPLFVAAATYDYHLLTGSPAINAGADPGTGAGMSLTPASQYVETAKFEVRPSDGTLDLGAFEFGVGIPPDAGSPAGPDAAAAPGLDAGTVTAADATAASGTDAIVALPSDGAVVTTSDASTAAKVDAGGSGEVDTGCGCSSTGSAAGGLGLAMLALGLLRRRVGSSV